MSDRQNTDDEQTLFPTYRRGRVAFAFCLFSIGLCALSYVSSL
ncbi:hypothetical protein [Marinobacter sp.]